MTSEVEKETIYVTQSSPDTQLFARFRSQTKKIFKLLVDTGAGVSTLNETSLESEDQLKKSDGITIKGLGARIRTLGTVRKTFIVGNCTMTHDFQVLPKTTEVPGMGILGMDAMIPSSAKIDLQRFELVMEWNEQKVAVPLEDRLRHSFALEIPARSQLYAKIPLDTTGTVCVEGQSVAEGVVMAHGVANVTKGEVGVMFINITEKPVVIGRPRPLWEPYEDMEQNEEKKASAERWEALKAQIAADHLAPQTADQLRALCQKYNDVFQIEGDPLPTTPVGKQTIELQPGTTPVYKKQFRNPIHQRDLILEHVRKLERQDVVEPANSGWNAPLLLIPKKKAPGQEQKYRVCIDYRGLNNVVSQDRWPLANIQDIMDQLSGSMYFSCMDLSQGYFQVELDEKSRPYTAFSTPDGKHWQMKRMPMGLCTSPAAFSRMMTMAMSGLQGLVCLVYLDDLIVFSKTKKQHFENLAQVFERLRATNLKIHPTKSHFLKKTVIFLGYKITGNGIVPDPDRIETIKNWPSPKNKAQVQSFFGLANFYRQFVKNFAQVAEPLNALLRKGVRFVWTEACEEAFQTMKGQLARSDILAFPDFSKEFVVSTDASAVAMGAVLANADGRPVHFASRIFRKAELNYSTIEKELKAICFATEVFRPYLLGNKFVLKTDHAPLKWLFGMAKPSSRLTKFRLELEPFSFDVEHVPGKDNVVADALSRKLTSEELRELQTTAETNWVKEMLQERQCFAVTRAQAAKRVQLPDGKGEHPVTKEPVDQMTLPKVPHGVKLLVWMTKRSGKLEQTTTDGNATWNGKILKVIEETQGRLTGYEALEKFLEQEKPKLLAVREKDYRPWVGKLLKKRKTKLLFIPNETKVVQSKHKEQLLHDYHVLPTAAHAGINRMFRTLRRQYYWPGMIEDVRKKVESCMTCKLSKRGRTIKVPMVETTTATRPFERVSLDLFGPLSSNDGGRNDYVLTMQDDLTKYLVCAHVKTKEAAVVAKTFVEEWVLKFGCPNEIVTDQGLEFKGITQEVMNLLEVKHQRATPYHHQTMGSNEATHKPLAEALRRMAERKAWVKGLKFFDFAYNNTVHSSTNYTPFELLYAQTVKRVPVLEEAPRKEPESYDGYVTKLRYAMQIAHDDARKAQLKKKHDRAQNPRDEVLQKDDQVLLKKETGPKLSDTFEGPYDVEKVDYPNAVLKMGNKLVTHHMDRMVKLPPHYCVYYVKEIRGKGLVKGSEDQN